MIRILEHKFYTIHYTQNTNERGQKVKEKKELVVYVSVMIMSCNNGDKTYISMNDALNETQ